MVFSSIIMATVTDQKLRKSPQLPDSSRNFPLLTENHWLYFHSTVAV